MESRLLIIEDDLELADYLRRGLTYEGYQVEVAEDAEAGLEKIRRSQPDLILLDLMLPGIDGIDACQRLRQSGHTNPILMITARNAVNDRVLGLDSGADDYLVKPFAFDELLARLRALERRALGGSRVVSFGDLELDSGQHAARRRGKLIPLSRTEYDLLSLFLAHPRQALTREAIFESVWGFEKERDGNMLDVYVSRLRRKLGAPPLIQTLYGVGYILEVGPG